MTARKKRAPRPRPPKVAPAPEPAAEPEQEPVYVNRVTLDNNVPGGFRYEQVAVPQPARS